MCKTASRRGKVGVLVSIAVLSACSFLAVTLLMRSEQTSLQEALFEAAADGNKAKVKELVAKGANVNKKNMDGFTLLHVAIEHGNNQMVEALLAGGVDVNMKIGAGLTPMQLLLKRSISPWLKKENFDYEGVAKQLLAHGATFDFQYRDGWRKTCIQQAISNNQIEILKLMLEKGADINFTEEKGGYVHYAIREKAKLDVIETLLSAGTDTAIRDKDGDTALHTAAYFGRGDVVRALLHRGVDINARNSKSMTALDVAKHPRGSFLGKRKEVIELLEQREENAQRIRSKGLANE
jgi:ankyrin repeat protein